MQRLKSWSMSLMEKQMDHQDPDYSRCGCSIAGYKLGLVRGESGMVTCRSKGGSSGNFTLSFLTRKLSAVKEGGGFGINASPVRRRHVSRSTLRARLQIPHLFNKINPSPSYQRKIRVLPDRWHVTSLSSYLSDFATTRQADYASQHHVGCSLHSRRRPTPYGVMPPFQWSRRYKISKASFKLCGHYSYHS
jgi:hypothetical protein